MGTNPVGGREGKAQTEEERGRKDNVMAMESNSGRGKGKSARSKLREGKRASREGGEPREREKRRRGRRRAQAADCAGRRLSPASDEET